MINFELRTKSPKIYESLNKAMNDVFSSLIEESEENNINEDAFTEYLKFMLTHRHITNRSTSFYEVDLELRVRLSSEA